MFYFIISFGLTAVLFVLGFSLSPKEIQFEKTSAYECGFELLLYNFLLLVFYLCYLI